MTKTNPNIYIFILLFSSFTLALQCYSLRHRYSSLFDFEGFSVMTILSLIVQVLTLLFSVYQLTFNKDQKKFTFVSIAYLIIGIPALIMLIIVGVSRQNFDQQWKYKLPLKEINTQILEGTLGWYVKLRKNAKPSITLKEYPNVVFNYVNDKDLNNRIKIGDKKIRLSEGDEIQLKIRSSTYEYLIENAISRTMKNNYYVEKYHIPYYALTHKDTLFFEKMYLK